MLYEPPRAAKKYSMTWEAGFSRTQYRVLRWVPKFLLSADGSESLALTAALMSLIPGLGNFYLTQRIWVPLAQFTGWILLAALYLFHFGTGWGSFLATNLFAFHQYLVYQSYVKGLRAREISPPGFLKGLGISALVALGLALVYFLAADGIGSHLYYATNSLGKAVDQGDRFYVTTLEDYQPGDIVTFNKAFQIEGRSFGSASLMERILAKGGDQVGFQNGKILVNGMELGPETGPLEEKIILPTNGLTVPKDHYLILYPIRTGLGFDPNWYFVGKSEIKGKLAFKIAPRMEMVP